MCKQVYCASRLNVLCARFKIFFLFQLSFLMNKVQSTDQFQHCYVKQCYLFWNLRKHSHLVNYVRRNPRWYLIGCDAPLLDSATSIKLRNYKTHTLNEQTGPQITAPDSLDPKRLVLFSSRTGFTTLISNRTFQVG